MRAKKLFAPTDDLTNSRLFIAALIILNSKAPVHYSVLLATEVIWTDKIPTAATDGVYVYINPAFFRGLASDSQRAFLLAHEVSHIILRHPQRSKVFSDRGWFTADVSFDHGLYNKAADYMINSDCDAMGLEPVPNGCYSVEYGRNDLVDAIYLSLHSNKPEKGDPSDQPDDDGDLHGENWGDSTDSDSSGPEPQPAPNDGLSREPTTPDKSEPELPDAEGHDYHLTPEYDGNDEEQEQAAAEDEHQLRSSVDDGIEQLERDGGEKAGLSHEIREGSHRYRESTASDTDWRAQLADRFNRAGEGGNVTWSRIHRRRFATLGVISPTTIGKIGRIGMVIDVSPSVNEQALNNFLTESASLIDSLQPRDGVVVCWTGSHVVQTDEVHSGSELTDIEVPYGGGTYMTSGVEYLDENGLECDLTVVFTDGEMMSYDWENLGMRENLVVVLDRMPRSDIQRDIDTSGTETIVAQAA